MDFQIFVQIRSLYYNLGTLITDNNFIINISDYDHSGLHPNNFVTNIKDWMTIHIPKNNFGWFGIRNQLGGRLCF